MQPLAAIAFGIIASIIMSYFLRIIRNLGKLKVHGIGSAIPRAAGAPDWVGPLTHLIIGLTLGVFYLYLGLALMPTTGGLAALGLAIGFARALTGAVVLTLLAIREDPWGHFVDAGPLAAMWHFAGSMLYGLALSALFGLSGVVPALGYY